MCGGLGALNPNTVVIPFFEDPYIIIILENHYKEIQQQHIILI